MTVWRSLAAAALLLALMGPLAIGLAAASGSSHRWPDVLAQFTAPALVAAVGLTLLLVLLGRGLPALIGAAVCGLLLAVCWPQWTPERGEPRPGAPVIRLYSANLWIHNADVKAIRRSIAAADPDMIALVELGLEPSARLDELLAGYPYRVQGSATRRRSGVAREMIASRWPIRALDPQPAGVSNAAGVVETPLGPVTLMAVHTTRPWPFEVQWEQVRHFTAVAEARADNPGAFIAAGDFNAVSSAWLGRRMKAGTDLTPAPGWPGTWPAWVPEETAITIDQVWRSPELALVSRRLGERNGSDHRPVVTEFTLAL